MTSRIEERRARTTPIHICMAPQQCTGRAKHLMRLLEASLYDLAVEEIRFMQQQGQCMVCGYPLDNSAPHPVVVGHDLFTPGVACALMAFLETQEFKDWLYTGELPEAFRPKTDPASDDA